MNFEVKQDEKKSTSRHKADKEKTWPTRNPQRTKRRSIKKVIKH